MSIPAAISGTFVGLSSIASRKVVRLQIECPVEMADHILEALGGYPDPANPKWVAVARLKTEPMAKSTETRSSRSFADLRPSAQAALRGKEPAFQRFLEEHYANGALVSSEAQAAEVTRALCEVESRSVLDRNYDAAERWRQISLAYDAWLQAA